jgi:hypothetical protein
MREVILHLPNAMYERLAGEAAAALKPLDQWIVDILMAERRRTLIPLSESLPCYLLTNAGSSGLSTFCMASRG